MNKCCELEIIEAHAEPGDEEEEEYVFANGKILFSDDEFQTRLKRLYRRCETSQWQKW